MLGCSSARAVPGRPLWARNLRGVAGLGAARRALRLSGFVRLLVPGRSSAGSPSPSPRPGHRPRGVLTRPAGAAPARPCVAIVANRNGFRASACVSSPEPLSRRGSLGARADLAPMPMDRLGNRRRRWPHQALGGLSWPLYGPGQGGGRPPRPKRAHGARPGPWVRKRGGTKVPPLVVVSLQADRAPARGPRRWLPLFRRSRLSAPPNIHSSHAKHMR